MTYVTTFGNELFDRYFVGSDRVMKQLNDHLTNTQQKQNNYPPYNIKKIEHNCYMVEMALAGFTKNDIDIVVEDGRLTVKGKLQTADNFEKEDFQQTYLYKGISDRAFTRQFTLADNVEVKKANLEHGMLKIYIEAVIPEHKKPKKIQIESE